MLLKVPYETAEERGVFLELEVEDKNLAGSFVPEEQQPLPDLKEAVAAAVENPIGSKKLSELLAGAKKVTIITENQFRQAPVREMLPVLIEKAKNAGAAVTIVIGCGKVPALSAAEIAEKLGEDIVKSGVEVYCNDVSQADNYVFKGITTAGTPVWIHRKVAEADVILTVSTTQATLWGYGGSGMIIPAVASNETIEINHVMSLAPDCVPGNNDCRMQLDKYEAARLSGIAMGINMIVNNRFEVTYINAGDFVAAHKEAVKVYDRVYRFDASAFKDNKADIVITGSSAPTDHLFFHTGWVNVNCKPIIKKGGTIIFTTPCPGYGDWPGFALMDLVKDFMPPTPENNEKALKAFYSHARELWAGCIWYKIYEGMLHADYYIVTRPENLAMARDFGFTVYDSLEQAYKDALAKHGANARVAFVPYGRYSLLE
ncbi:MAG: lactate racemase, partial [Clostridia bacterium]|nr:lactate racemase [Clostridia bacterium]